MGKHYIGHEAGSPDLNRPTRRAFFWKMSLTRTPDPIRPTRRVPDLTDPRGGVLTLTCLRGGQFFEKWPTMTMLASRHCRCSVFNFNFNSIYSNSRLIHTPLLHHHHHPHHHHHHHHHRFCVHLLQRWPADITSVYTYRLPVIRNTVYMRIVHVLQQLNHAVCNWITATVVKAWLLNRYNHCL